MMVLLFSKKKIDEHYINKTMHILWENQTALANILLKTSKNLAFLKLDLSKKEDKFLKNALKAFKSAERSLRREGIYIWTLLEFLDKYVKHTLEIISRFREDIQIEDIIVLLKNAFITIKNLKKTIQEVSRKTKIKLTKISVYDLRILLGELKQERIQ